MDKLNIISLTISILTFLFVVIFDLKTIIKNHYREKYLLKVYDMYLNKILLFCYINHSNQYNFVNILELTKINEVNIYDKIIVIINKLEQLQEEKIILSKTLEYKINNLKIINNLLFNLQNKDLKSILLCDNYTDSKIIKKLSKEIQKINSIENIKRIYSYIWK